MTQPSRTWTSHVEASGSDATSSHGRGYHPRCGEEHHHKPVKAVIGIGLLMVLSFVLYEFKTPEQHASQVEPHQLEQRQTVAANHTGEH